MPDKRALNSALGVITNAGVAFGSHVPANMRRYIYKIKTANQFAGPNQLQFGHQTAAPANVVLDWIEHAVQYDMWNDPDEIHDDSVPIYIIPAGSQPYGIASAAGNIMVYILYEDAP